MIFRSLLCEQGAQILEVFDRDGHLVRDKPVFYSIWSIEAFDHAFPLMQFQYHPAKHQVLALRLIGRGSSLKKFD
jgi:hypothetical protein